MIHFWSNLQRNGYKVGYICNQMRFLSSAEVTSALRPFYFLVHPDLFAQHPRAQHVNDVSLKLLNNHIDLLNRRAKPKPLQLQFYVRNRTEDESLRVQLVSINKPNAKSVIHSLLVAFQLPTKFVDKFEDTTNRNLTWTQNYHRTSMETEFDVAVTPRKKTLYKWLVENMAEAESRLNSSELIREDTKRLKEDILNEARLKGLSWERGLGTTHLRSCLQCLRTVLKQNQQTSEVVKGRHIHFGNQSGLSMEGSIILSTSEVRDQWVNIIMNASDYDSIVARIPHMQKAVSNSLKNIKVVARKYQPFLLVNHYSQNLKRLVTSLGDYKGKTGFPTGWPETLHHIQLVVESANGPLMLSPTGQIIAPSSCPPCLLVNFISENMEEASKRIAEYEKMRIKERALYSECMRTLQLEFLDKDDSVVPERMVSCLERLISGSNRLSPLFAGSRLWITQYYSVLLDGEVCIPWNWDCDDIG